MGKFNKLRCTRKITLVLMIVVMVFIILGAMAVYLIDLPWYFCALVTIFLMGQIMTLNYEIKTILDQGLVAHNPSKLSQILPRTLSIFYYHDYFNFDEIKILKSFSIFYQVLNPKLFIITQYVFIKYI